MFCYSSTVVSISPHSSPPPTLDPTPLWFCPCVLDDPSPFFPIIPFPLPSDYCPNFQTKTQNISYMKHWNKCGFFLTCLFQFRVVGPVQARAKPGQDTFLSQGTLPPIPTLLLEWYKHTSSPHLHVLEMWEEIRVLRTSPHAHGEKVQILHRVALAGV